ncbi:hypothetical protein KJ359_009896 [Pestalotiopsis sp. 9143b]|nr:hypothetical protein KJ359_009896 [Pestalotiopsis sp. 9143b]
MKFSLVVLASAAAVSATPLSIGTGSLTGGLTGGLTSGLTSGLTGTLTGTLGTLTSQVSQLTQLTQLPTCAVSCISASATKAATGSVTLAGLGKLCSNVTGVLNGATTCLAACKLPVSQATTVTSTLKNVCAIVHL